MKQALSTIAQAAAVVSLTCCSLVHAASWDSGADYSITNNPNGEWSYNRKFAVTGTAADVMTVRWDSTGWYLGNFGHGGPSFYAGPHLWAKNNTNGYPALRWTTPASGSYNISGAFTGDDNRGVDNFVYVVVNGITAFTGRVTGYLDQESFTFNNLNLNTGEPVDFVLTWAGGVNSELGWTQASVQISAVPEVQSAWLIGLGLMTLALKRRLVGNAGA